MKLEPLDIAGVEDLITPEQIESVLPDMHPEPTPLQVDPRLCYPDFNQSYMIPTTNDFSQFTASNTSGSDSNEVTATPAVNPYTYMYNSQSISPENEMIKQYMFNSQQISPDSEMINSMFSGSNLSDPNTMLPYYLSMDFYQRNNKVGKRKSRRRATGIATIDPGTGKKVITAATCQDCYKAKKKCIYTLGYDACNRCAKRGVECVKRVDRRCQKVWCESGRTVPALSANKGVKRGKKCKIKKQYNTKLNTTNNNNNKNNRNYDNHHVFNNSSILRESSGSASSSSSTPIMSFAKNEPMPTIATMFNHNPIPQAMSYQAPVIMPQKIEPVLHVNTEMPTNAYASFMEYQVLHDEATKFMNYFQKYPKEAEKMLQYMQVQQNQNLQRSKQLEEQQKKREQELQKQHLKEFEQQQLYYYPTSMNFTGELELPSPNFSDIPNLNTFNEEELNKFTESLKSENL